MHCERRQKPLSLTTKGWLTVSAESELPAGNLSILDTPAVITDRVPDIIKTYLQDSFLRSLTANQMNISLQAWRLYMSQRTERGVRQTILLPIAARAIHTIMACDPDIFTMSAIMHSNWQRWALQQLCLLTSAANVIKVDWYIHSASSRIL